MRDAWYEIEPDALEAMAYLNQGLERNEKGRPMQSIANCVYVMENDPMLRGAIRLNQFTGMADIVRTMPWKRANRTITDDDVCQINLYMEMFYGLKNERSINKALSVVATRNTYHPVQMFLNKREWDGQERIRHVLHRYLGVEENELNYECMKIFLLGAIKRVFEPGCKMETILCLVGEQGMGKSTILRFLAVHDAWFSDDLKKLDDENVYRKMASHWIIEMAEMLGTSRAKSVEEIKAFLSRQKDTYKVPYDKYPKDQPRQCVFVGTTNRKRFLPLDRTGNRRFHPIMTDVNQAEEFILKDEAASRAYIEQVWAEAMTIYRSGEYSLKLSPELEKEMSLRRLDFMAEDVVTGMIQAWLDNYSGDFVCTKMIFHGCYHGYGDPDAKAIAEINGVMNNTISGWKAGPQHRFEFYGQQRSWVRIKPDVPPEPPAVNSPKQLEMDVPQPGTVPEGFTLIEGDDPDCPF